MKHTLVILFAMGLALGHTPSWAQVTVELPKIVLEAKHTEYVATQNPGTPNILNVKSSNPSVATAQPYQASRVQIVGVAPGSTMVEFFDGSQQKQYKVMVWVTAPNVSGGGGQGYNPQLTQLPQIVMLVKHTENAHTPNDSTAKLSGVKSSNPGVATARTDPPRGIQIYAVALGDTWVEFTDNETGKTYQVHVWVKDALPSAAGGGAGGGPSQAGTQGKQGGGGGSGSAAVGGGGGGGPIDPCLVGNWEAVDVKFLKSTGSWSGGSGFTISFKEDGTVNADYTKMQPLTEAKGDAFIYTGTASGRISTANQVAKIQGIQATDVTMTMKAGGQTFPPGKLGSLGPGGLGNSANDNGYTCSGDSLAYNASVALNKPPNFAIKLKRLK